MRRAQALIGGALALSIALAGCADAGRQGEANAPDEASVAQTQLAGGDTRDNQENAPEAQANVPTGAAVADAQPTVSTLPTAVAVPAPASSPVASEAGGGPAGAAASGFGTVPFTRTEVLTIGADGSLAAEPIQVRAGELFALTLANSGSGDVLMRVPLGDAGELGVVLRAMAGPSAGAAAEGDSMATTDNGGDSGATTSGGTSTTSATPAAGDAGATGGSASGDSGSASGDSGSASGATGDSAADSTTGGGTGGSTADSNTGAANSAGAANSQGGSTGGPSGGADTATGGSNDNIITDSAAAVPTIEAGGTANTEGSQMGSAAQGSASSAAAGSTAGMSQGAGAGPVTLLLRFSRPGTYTISCVPLGDAGTGVGGAAAGDVQQSDETNAGAPAGDAQAQPTGAPADTAATPAAGDTAAGESGGAAPSAMSGGCSGEVTIVVGEAAAETGGASTTGGATSTP